MSTFVLFVYGLGGEVNRSVDVVFDVDVDVGVDVGANVGVVFVDVDVSARCCGGCGC